MSETRDDGGSAYFPPGPPPIEFDTFAGLNTQPSRAGIGDKQMFACDGFMPVGDNFLRTLYGVGDPTFTAGTIGAVQFFDFFNLGQLVGQTATKFCIVFLADGSITVVDTDTHATAQIAPPGTITNVNRNSVGVTQWGRAFLLIVAQQTDGYFAWDGGVFYSAGDPVPGYGTMPTGIEGTALDIFQSRVWVVNDDTVEFSAPGDFTDFSTADGGGTFQPQESWLRVSFTQVKNTNGFLYFIGDSSVSYISPPVTTGGSPVATTFNFQNADPEIGSPYPASVQTFSRDLVFANAWGIHTSYGGAVKKVSPELDGIFNLLPNFNGFNVSSAKAVIFGKRVYMALAPTVLPFTPLDAYCPQGVTIATPQEIATAGALAGLPATFAQFMFSTWTNLPADGATRGFWFSNQDDDTAPANAGIQIGIFNPTASPTYQIIVTAYDSANTWIMQAAYAALTWSDWVWVGISVDTAAQVIQCYVNAGSGDIALTPAIEAWNSTNPVANATGHAWHVQSV